MNKKDKHLQDLSEIRLMMENNSKFLSLSGLSGIATGLCAILGAFITHQYLIKEGIWEKLREDGMLMVTFEQLAQLIGLACTILVTSMSLSIYFSRKMAIRKKLPFWNATARKTLLSMLVPLMAGGVFCVYLAHYGFGGMVAATTLLFYGLALLNASKYTFKEIRYLALSEIGLGLLAMGWLGHGLLFWVVGFGFLHILYGVWMYIRYEQA